MNLLPLGWGGLVAPVVVLMFSFMFTFPFALFLQYVWKKPGLSIFIDWRFIVVCLPLFSAVTYLIIYLAFPLDGGGSVFSRYLF